MGRTDAFAGPALLAATAVTAVTAITAAKKINVSPNGNQHMSSLALRMSIPPVLVIAPSMPRPVIRKPAVSIQQTRRRL